MTLNRTYLHYTSLNPAEHSALISWIITVSIFTILGNGAVLISSIKFNAIKVDRISIILIRNLAIADLGYGVYLGLTAGYVFTRSNIFGKHFLSYKI